MEHVKDDLAFFFGLISGAVVGGIAAALLVPRSAPELREHAIQRGVELTNRTEALVQQAQQAAQAALDRTPSAGGA